MAPVIPSPTPIQGIPPAPGREPALRLPADTLATDPQYADVFNLYILALSRFQSTGNEEFDKDNDKGTSYFQICGIHGTPFVNWQKDPTPPQYNGIAAGYCTHASVLFLPWHRPYLALYEQILWQYAQDIVKNEFKGDLQVKYAEALNNVRLPYWDWASNSHLPDVTKKETLSIVTPTGTDPNFPNPLYSYKYTSGMGIDSCNNELQNPLPDPFLGSVRCPNTNGPMNNDIADAQNFALQDQHKQGIYNLMSVSDFGQFSNQAYHPGEGYDSLEHHHGQIHNYTGSDFSQTGTVAAPVAIGNMTDLWSSSFDPIFWLHHSNVERLWNIWQALFPSATIDPEKPLLDRWTQGSYLNGVNTGDNALEPFHKTSAHDMKDYFIANELRDVFSSYELGYQYPETPFRLANNPPALAAFAREQVNKLYGPQLKANEGFTKQPLVGLPKLEGAAAHYRTEWVAFVRAKRFAIPGSWNIFIFLGEPNADPSKWALESVGTVAVFAPRNIGFCKNCLSQEGAGMEVSGVVYLTDALSRKVGEELEEDKVVEYLKENLHWRVGKPGVGYPTENIDGLKVGVESRPFLYPASKSELAIKGERKLHPEITGGRAQFGGFAPGDTF